MYKIILTFQSKLVGDINTIVFTYFDIEYCREQIKVLKDRYTSIGSTILTFNIVDTSIEAGRAYLIHTEATPITEFSASMVEVSPSVNIRQSAQLQPNFDEDITFDEEDLQDEADIESGEEPVGDALTTDPEVKVALEEAGIEV